MNYKLVPKNYQEDSEETRKEMRLQITYEKMYHEDYVNDLIKQIHDLSVTAETAIGESKNRGTQRCAIPIIRKGYQTVRKFKDEVPTVR
jgi:hypothetical protein